MQSNNKETIKYALYNKEGKVLLPYNSDKLEILTNNLIRKNNKNTYLRVKEGRIIKTEFIY